MNEDLIELPETKDIKELLVSAKNDINEEIKQDPSLGSQSRLMLSVIKIIEDKLARTQDLNTLELTEKINVAAHLNFLQDLLEDFFFAGDYDENEGEEFDLDGFEEEAGDEK